MLAVCQNEDKESLVAVIKIDFAAFRPLWRVADYFSTDVIGVSGSLESSSKSQSSKDTDPVVSNGSALHSGFPLPPSHSTGARARHSPSDDSRPNPVFQNSYHERLLLAEAAHQEPRGSPSAQCPMSRRSDALVENLSLYLICLNLALSGSEGLKWCNALVGASHQRSMSRFHISLVKTGLRRSARCNQALAGQADASK